MMMIPAVEPLVAVVLLAGQPEDQAAAPALGQGHGVADARLALRQPLEQELLKFGS